MKSRILIETEKNLDEDEQILLILGHQDQANNTNRVPEPKRL
jgi:hypothetical protein